MSIRRTLCITNDFGPNLGGIETFVIGLIERMPHGSVIVYTRSQPNTEPFDARWLENYGVRVIRDKSKVLLPSLRVGRNVRRVVRDEQIESVFFGAAAPLALLAAGVRRAGAKRIVALTHGHEVWWAKVFPFRCALRQMGKNLDALTYLGEFTRSQISKPLTKKARESMVRIAPGIDTEHFMPRTDIKDIQDEHQLHGKRVIVCVGRLVNRKGQDVLIQSMPEILSKHPDAHLLIVGVGPHEDYLHELVHSLDLKNHVSFVGRVQHVEIRRYMSVGEVFAMPSRSRLGGLEVEGLGIVYLEASACGLPVVGSLSGGAPDAVLEGETGLCVDGRNHLAVAGAIVELLDDPERARAMGARGREWIVQEWEWRVWSAAFNKLLEPTQ